MCKIKFINYNNIIKSYLLSLLFLRLKKQKIERRMREWRGRRGGSGASRTIKGWFASTSSGVNILRERLRRSRMHTKLRGTLKIGVAIGKADEHARSWQFFLCEYQTITAGTHWRTSLKKIVFLTLQYKVQSQKCFFFVISFLHQLQASFHQLLGHFALKERSWFVLWVDVSLNSFGYTIHVSAKMVARRALCVSPLILKS